ncbi:NUDIX domain-containing protein [Candidatus Uhrbacteria bacterium]|nr:NUDIX domain-containing protein [Candidatus Uhrbacteria bacterium]
MSVPEGLPASARQVFKGEIWEIWQWEQEEFDGSVKIYERAVRADSVTVIPIVGDKILIQHQEQPFRGAFLSLPGGFREDEDPLHDGMRELLEETGHISDEWRHYFTWSPTASKLMWKNHFYIASRCRKIQEMTLDPGEKISLDLISYDDFIALADNPAWRHRDLVPTLLRARYVPEKYRELRNRLFGVP